MIKFDLGGGNYNGNGDPLIIFAANGDVITIPDAPIKEGYKFLYWKGSEYYPGDKYTVTGDHTMTAQWEKITGPAKNDKSVRTGDSNNILFWIVVMLGALLAVSVSATVIIKRKERFPRSCGKK